MFEIVSCLVHYSWLNYTTVLIVQCHSMQAISKVISLDREAFPSLNGLPGETHHSVSVLVATYFCKPICENFFPQYFTLLSYVID